MKDAAIFEMEMREHTSKPIITTFKKTSKAKKAQGELKNFQKAISTARAKDKGNRKELKYLPMNPLAERFASIPSGANAAY